MKCIKKLVALTLAAVLALTMLTACGGTSAPSAPLHETSTEVRTQVLNGLNKTRAELGKPDLKENAEVDLLAERYMAALKKCGANWNDTDMKNTRSELVEEARALKIDGAEVTITMAQVRYTEGTDKPLVDGGYFGLDKTEADYVGIAVDNIGSKTYTIAWLIKTAS